METEQIEQEEDLTALIEEISNEQRRDEPLPEISFSPLNHLAQVFDFPPDHIYPTLVFSGKFDIRHAALAYRFAKRENRLLHALQENQETAFLTLAYSEERDKENPLFLQRFPENRQLALLFSHQRHLKYATRYNRIQNTPNAYMSCHVESTLAAEALLSEYPNIEPYALRIQREDHVTDLIHYLGMRAAASKEQQFELSQLETTQKELNAHDLLIAAQPILFPGYEPFFSLERRLINTEKVPLKEFTRARDALFGSIKSYELAIFLEELNLDPQRITPYFNRKTVFDEFEDDKIIQYMDAMLNHAGRWNSLIKSFYTGQGYMAKDGKLLRKISPNELIAGKEFFIDPRGNSQYAGREAKVKGRCSQCSDLRIIVNEQDIHLRDIGGEIYEKHELDVAQELTAAGYENLTYDTVMGLDAAQAKEFIRLQEKVEKEVPVTTYRGIISIEPNLKTGLSLDAVERRLARLWPAAQ